MCFDIWATKVKLCTNYVPNYVPKCQMSSGPFGPILCSCNIQAPGTNISYCNKIRAELLAKTMEHVA